MIFGGLFNRHKHDYKMCKRWCYINGDLICQRWERCECGSDINAVNLIVATEKDLAEANLRRLDFRQHPGATYCGASS